MNLRKTNENVTRIYDADGIPSDRVDCINYAVLDPDGNKVGDAFVNSAESHVNINIYGFSSIADGDQKLKTLLNVE